MYSSFVIRSTGALTILGIHSCFSEQLIYHNAQFTMAPPAKRSKVGSACQRCRRQKLKVSRVFTFRSTVRLIPANLNSATSNALARYASVLGSIARQRTSGE
jgi:hypothetical protein